MKRAPGILAELDNSRRLILVAHRGNVPGLPENTLPAFREVVRLGVPVVEFDLRETADGEFVVMHDETVDRTTNGTGKVSGLTLKEIRRLDAGSGALVPTYREVVEIARGTPTKLLVDIKPGVRVDRLVELTLRLGAQEQVILGARSVLQVRKIASSDPSLAVLGFVRDPSEVGAYVEAGAHIVRLWSAWIRNGVISAGDVRGMDRPIWVMASPTGSRELQALIEWGANGIIADLTPEVLAFAIERGLIGSSRGGAR